jgi:hypothetical protein
MCSRAVKPNNELPVAERIVLGSPRLGVRPTRCAATYLRSVLLAADGVRRDVPQWLCASAFEIGAGSANSGLLWCECVRQTTMMCRSGSASGRDLRDRTSNMPDARANQQTLPSR